MSMFRERLTVRFHRATRLVIVCGSVELFRHRRSYEREVLIFASV